MIASVHIADIGAATALRALGRTPKSKSTTGLRHANVAIAAPLSSSTRPSPQFGRFALLAFWNDEASLDRFLDADRLAEQLRGGWQARLEPLRMHGSWPGVPDDVSQSRSVDYSGPAVVFTLGRLRLTQTRRFIRTSAQAEGAATQAPGLVWGTGLARPPFVATCSVWESSRALATYAYGHSEPAHHNAIETDQTKPFHHQSAFIRFRPLASSGSLGGRNPFTDTAILPSGS
jgi:hypothetical protein